MSLRHPVCVLSVTCRYGVYICINIYRCIYTYMDTDVDVDFMYVLYQRDIHVNVHIHVDAEYERMFVHPTHYMCVRVCVYVCVCVSMCFALEQIRRIFVQNICSCFSVGRARAHTKYGSHTHT